jgi:hypothetical protein
MSFVAGLDAHRAVAAFNHTRPGNASDVRLMASLKICFFDAWLQ